MTKNILLLLFLLIFSSSTELNAQRQAERLLKQAQRSHTRNEYKEAFELLRNAEQELTADEKSKGQKFTDTRYGIIKERLQMYLNLRNSKRAQDQIERMEGLLKGYKNDSLQNDLLYSKANCYYTFGKSSQGDVAINQLIGQYKEQKQYDKVNECYKTLINIARRAGNAALTARAYDKFILWNDSLKALTAQDELNALQLKYDKSLEIIQEKDNSLSTKQYIIIGLCALAAILAAILVFGGIVLVRYIFLTRKQKKSICIANEHNELKSHFIRNISTQMAPTLNSLDNSLPEVRALHSFASHIQELSDLENSLTIPYEMEEKNVSSFCESIMDKIKGKTKEDVSLSVNAPRLNVKIASEPLERILLHLLDNAARYTPEGGKIWLDFKKRGAHTHQFIVSDTGAGIPEERREDLFKPFSEIKDLTKGDGLGLPICSLMATKMNGTLSLDNNYTKGTRFILELHT